jgi:hypothetical protein
MRMVCAARRAVLPTVLAVLAAPGWGAPGWGARADTPAASTATLVRVTPASLPAVFHDDVDAGRSSLPGVDVIDYRATLTTSDGPVHDVSVTLERVLAPGTTWRAIGTATTDASGVADFSTPVRGNGAYRVSYAGSDTTGPSTSPSVSLEAMRDFNARLVEKASGVYLRGNVNPGWGHRTVTWQRRTCSTCAWRRVDRARTSRTGAWGFQGAFPPHGRTWWFRARLASTSTFVTSTSSMLRTRR